MLTTERHAIILQLLLEKHSITLQDIMEVLPISESTVRRDLVELEQAGELERVHGGAVHVNKKLTEAGYVEKSVKNIQDKRQIGQIAASLIQKGDCLYLDAGSTVIQLIPYLQDKEVVVVTNGLTHVEELMKYNITTYVTGGKIKSTTKALVGPQTIESLRAYRFDKCFLGANGFSTEYGYTTPDPEEACVKHMASSLSKVTYVMADCSKDELVSFSKMMSLDEAVLITVNLSAERLAQLPENTLAKEMLT